MKQFQAKVKSNLINCYASPILELAPHGRISDFGTDVGDICFFRKVTHYHLWPKKWPGLSQDKPRCAEATRGHFFPESMSLPNFEAMRICEKHEMWNHAASLLPLEWTKKMGISHN
jgi:hypothetical protein